MGTAGPRAQLGGRGRGSLRPAALPGGPALPLLLSSCFTSSCPARALCLPPAAPGALCPWGLPPPKAISTLGPWGPSPGWRWVPSWALPVDTGRCGLPRLSWRRQGRCGRCSPWCDQAEGSRTLPLWRWRAALDPAVWRGREGRACPPSLKSQQFPSEGAIRSQLISISSEGCTTLGFSLVMFSLEQYLLFLQCLIFLSRASVACSGSFHRKQL